MQVQFYSFPMENDGETAIEKALQELEKRERQGERLAQEEIDWIQYAENHLYLK